MANKALATRQKMQFRVEPSQKPRNPVAVAAKLRAKPLSAERQAAKRALAKAPLKPPEDE